MSTLDTLAPFISMPWLDRDGQPLPVRPLPGLCSEVSRELRFSCPGSMSPDYRELLTVCSGLAGTAIGHIDFTGCWFPEEACSVFNTCLTLAVDDEGRRWISEISADGTPGSVWCLFAAPQVAVFVSEDLATFLGTLQDRTCTGRLFSWLQDLSAQAHAIWANRSGLALRPYQAAAAHTELAIWLVTLPTDAYVYDLRSPMAARGWPFGLAGPSGRLFRFGRLLVFAIAGPSSDSSRFPHLQNLRQLRVGARSNSHVIPWPAHRPERNALSPPAVSTLPWEQRLCA